MEAQLQAFFNSLVASQKWNCYIMHEDGFILEGEWAYANWGTPYPPGVMEKAESFNRAKWARLFDLAEASPAKSEVAFSMETAYATHVDMRD